MTTNIYFFRGATLKIHKKSVIIILSKLSPYIFSQIFIIDFTVDFEERSDDQQLGGATLKIHKKSIFKILLKLSSYIFSQIFIIDFTVDFEERSDDQQIGGATLKIYEKSIFKIINQNLIKTSGHVQFPLTLDFGSTTQRTNVLCYQN